MVSNISNPLFCIITPSYNRPELVKRALNSVLMQDYQNWKVFVVDDGSSTDTLAALTDLEKLDSRIKVYFLPKNQGVNFVRNYALNRISESSSMCFVSFLDDDDQLCDGCLTSAAEVIQKQQKYQWIIGNCIDPQGRVVTKVKSYGQGNYIDDYMFSSKLRGDAMHFISLEAIGSHRFTQKFRNSEEWSWFLSIAKQTDFYSVNCDWKLVDYQVDGLSAKKVNDDKKLNVFKLKEELCLDLNPAYLAEQRMLLAREYFKKCEFTHGKEKLFQSFSKMRLNPKWYQILLFGIYKRVFG